LGVIVTGVFYVIWRGRPAPAEVVIIKHRLAGEQELQVLRAEIDVENSKRDSKEAHLHNRLYRYRFVAVGPAGTTRLLHVLLLSDHATLAVPIGQAPTGLFDAVATK